MQKNRSLIEDMVKLGENALGNLLGARHEFGAQAKTGLDSFARKLDLVSREEFNAAFGMLAKARLIQEELGDRLAVIEKKLNLTPPMKVKKATKANLRSVKQGNQTKGKRK